MIAHDAAEKRKRFSDYMSLTTSAVGQSGLDRIEAMLAATCGLTRPEYTEPLHQPLLLYLRGLRTVRWHDPREFAWSDVLEREFCSIREELDRVLKDGVFQPYLAPFDENLHSPRSTPKSQVRSLRRWKAGKGEENFDTGWNAHFLYRHGEWIAVNSVMCPRTKYLLSLTPMALGEALFSVLAHDTWIQPHTGGCNVVLTCHLPLIVPDRCGICVGGETREWEEGKLMIFDDTYLHSAWNRSDRQRANMIWDIWHPDLTEVERHALKILFPIIVNNRQES